MAKPAIRATLPFLVASALFPAHAAASRKRLFLVDRRPVATPVVQDRTDPLPNDPLSVLVDLEAAFHALGSTTTTSGDAIRATGIASGNVEFRIAPGGRWCRYRDSSFTDSAWCRDSVGIGYQLLDGRWFVGLGTLRYIVDGDLDASGDSVFLYTKGFVRTDLPETLDECYALLDRTLSAKARKAFKATAAGDLYTFHFTLGLQIRNAWIRPGGSRIVATFATFGIHDPDAISDAILEGYHRHLHGERVGMRDLFGNPYDKR